MAKINRRQIKIYLFTIIFCTYLIFVVADAFSVRKTYAAMEALKGCIQEYAALNKRLPLSLKDMIGAEGIECGIGDIKDKWGKPIVYKVDDGGEVVLMSTGADRAAGGKDAAADIIVKFKVK